MGGDAGSGGETTEGLGDKENQEPDNPTLDDDEALDLENFGKKKKKKKKAFNLDELDAALPDSKKEVSLHYLKKNHSRNSTDSK